MLIVATKNLILAIVAGLVVNLAFPDTGWWPLAFVGIAMLWIALREATPWRGFFLTWMFGIAFLLPHVYWAHESVGAVPWIALSVAEGAFIGLFGAAWAVVRRAPSRHSEAPWWSPFAFALLWVGMEQIRSIIPFGGFPWGRIGFSQVDAPIARFAWIGGVPLVSFVTVTIGAALGLGLEALLRRRLVIALALPIGGAAILACGFLVPLDTQATDGQLRAGMVQGNVPNAGLDAFAQARQVTENHRDGTLALVESDPGPMDLVVWPENSADYDPRTDAESAAMVEQSAQAAGVPILLGTNDYSPEEGRYNTSLLWAPGGEILDTYSKQRPAPFAEYIPMREIAGYFSDAVDLVQTEVIPGVGPATVEVPVENLGRDVTVGTIICFEVAYDGIVTDAVNAGAEVLFVQTNNANFGLTAESTQQLQMTRMRAIETGRATVQISTVGVSGVVAPNGRLLDETGLFTAEQMYASLPLRTEITPAVKYDWLWHYGFLVLPAAAVVVGTIRTVRERYEW
ncbi:apolipoprotein N-acyltransferase [Demequina flava]|uniref:apolipoprotein N-acyltransferase n=1 Tax=Demequina flava TaxID=1095025 RepID=UPI000785A90E|nr:apolipoprotein N-acyltransferase [Demequina flava]